MSNNQLLSADYWQTRWPIALAAAYLLLLPFARLAEIPLILLALAAPWLLWQQRGQARWRELLPVSILFCGFWLPMLISSIDSFASEKSLVQTVAALRFLAAAISLQLLLRTTVQQRYLLMILAAIIAFWIIDVLIQVVSGVNLLGFSANTQRLGGIFADDIWFFGPTLAMLSPLLLEWAWYKSNKLYILGLLTLLSLAVLLAGMRAGWLLIPIITAIYAWRFIRLRRQKAVKLLAIYAAIVCLSAVIVVEKSDIVQQRLIQTQQLLQADEAAVQFALSERIGIWKTSWRMIKAHSINGVGVRAFPVAYGHFSDSDDPQLLKGDSTRGSRHAHNLWLEALTDCGLIGFFGLTLFVLYLLVSYKNASLAQRTIAFPFLFSLGLVLFPLNSHFSLYGTFLSSTLWWLTGLYLAALHTDDSSVS